MRILIGIDGSEQAQRALRWGLREAALHAADVSIVHVFPVPVLRGAGDHRRSDRERRSAAHELAANAVARAGALDDVTIDIDVIPGINGAIAGVLLDRARDSDLVVVGSRGRGGFSGLLLGSVSQQVSAHAPVPVAVIPTDRDADGPSDAVREIVVGVDGSRHAVAALRWAVREAQVRKCPLTALYVYPPPAATLTSDVIAGLEQAVVESFYAHSYKIAQDVVDELIAREYPGAATTIKTRVAEGSAGHMLVDEAADPETMLVVGSRGRGGFAGLLLGSVSQQCLHHARGPVVVVHHPT